MLKPAILYKDQLEKMFTEIIYTKDYYYYNGYAYEHELPKITLDFGLYQYAILDGEDVVGFLAYRIDNSTDSVFNFGLISFQKGNLTVVSDVLHEFKKLNRMHRRIEWRCVGSNPVRFFYDKLCERYKGNRLTLHDACATPYGTRTNCYIYEICNFDIRC